MMGLQVSCSRSPKAAARSRCSQSRTRDSGLRFQGPVVIENLKAPVYIATGKSVQH